MTDLDLAELRAKAEAATPGPWATHLVDDMSIVAGSRDEIASTAPPGYGTDDDVDFETDTDRCEANAAFIAAANPAAILALIERVKKAEAEAFAMAAGQCVVGSGVIGDEYGNMTCPRSAEIDRLRALLARAGEALAPFHLLAPGEARDWADEYGWTDRAPKNERICDWFGPTDFRTARDVAREIEEIAV